MKILLFLSIYDGRFSKVMVGERVPTLFYTNHVLDRPKDGDESRPPVRWVANVEFCSGHKQRSPQLWSCVFVLFHHAYHLPYMDDFALSRPSAQCGCNYSLTGCLE